MAGAVELGDDLGRGVAECLDADAVPFIHRIGQEIAEHLQMCLVRPDGGKRQTHDRPLVGKEIISVTDGPVPRKMPRMIHEPADQTFTSTDRADRKVPSQLLPFPACEHILEDGVRRDCALTQRKPDQLTLQGVHHASDASANDALIVHKMRINVKETPEISEIICPLGHWSLSTVRCGELMPGASSNSLDPCNRKDFNVRAVGNGKGVSLSPNRQILQLDNFHLT